MVASMEESLDSWKQVTTQLEERTTSLMVRHLWSLPRPQTFQNRIVTSMDR